MKKKVILLVICLILIAICLILINIKSNKTNEKELNSNLEILGKEFYKSYYKTQSESQDDIKEFLKGFEETGITINLSNLSNVLKDSEHKKLIDSMYNSETKAYCDYKKTSVTIYPKSPYGEEDYTIKTNLDCGF